MWAAWTEHACNGLRNLSANLARHINNAGQFNELLLTIYLHGRCIEINALASAMLLPAARAAIQLSSIHKLLNEAVSSLSCLCFWLANYYRPQKQKKNERDGPVCKENNHIIASYIIEKVYIYIHKLHEYLQYLHKTIQDRIGNGILINIQ